MCRSLLGTFHLVAPDEFIIRTQAKPRLVESDDVMPCLIALDFELLQSSPGQIDSLVLLRIKQSMWHLSKVTRHESQRLGKTAIDSRRREMGQSRELPYPGKRAIFKNGYNTLI
jgi:hypothetical protein